MFKNILIALLLLLQCSCESIKALTNNGSSQESVEKIETKKIDENINGENELTIEIGEDINTFKVDLKTPINSDQC